MDADLSAVLTYTSKETEEMHETGMGETTVVPTPDAGVLDVHESWPSDSRVDVLYDDLWWRCVVFAPTAASDDRLWVRFDVDGSILPIKPQAVPEMVRAPGPNSDVATELPPPPAKKPKKTKTKITSAKSKSPSGKSKVGRPRKATASSQAFEGTPMKRPSDEAATKTTTTTDSPSTKRPKVESKPKAPRGRPKKNHFHEASTDLATSEKAAAKAVTSTSKTAKNPASATTKARAKTSMDNGGVTSTTVAAAGVYTHLGQRMSSEFTVAPKRAAGKPTGSRADWVYRQQLAGPLLRVKTSASDDFCWECRNGGKLVCCSSCPRAYHVACCGSTDDQKEVKALKDSDSWHCSTCIQGHSALCLACGAPGDDETRLLPCATCPRAYHYECAQALAPNSNHVSTAVTSSHRKAASSLACSGPDGRWACHRCIAPPPPISSVYSPVTIATGRASASGAPASASPAGAAAPTAAAAATCGTVLSVDSSGELELLQQLVTLCAKFPAAHFASLVGEEVAAALRLTRDVQALQASLARRKQPAVAQGLPPLPGPAAAEATLDTAANVPPAAAPIASMTDSLVVRPSNSTIQTAAAPTASTAASVSAPAETASKAGKAAPGPPRPAAITGLHGCKSAMEVARRMHYLRDVLRHEASAEGDDDNDDGVEGIEESGDAGCSGQGEGSASSSRNRIDEAYPDVCSAAAWDLRPVASSCAVPSLLPVEAAMEGRGSKSTSSVGGMKALESVLKKARAEASVPDMCYMCGGATVEPPNDNTKSSNELATSAKANASIVKLGPVLLCEGCDAEAHLRCTGMAEVPKGNWFCSRCTESAQAPSSSLSASSAATATPLTAPAATAAGAQPLAAVAAPPLPLLCLMPPHPLVLAGNTSTGNGNDLQRRREQFLLEGVCTLPRALSHAQASAANDAALDYFEAVQHTLRQLDLLEDLASEGFSTFKLRAPGRYDMVVPAFISSSQPIPSDAASSSSSASSSTTTGNDAASDTTSSSSSGGNGVTEAPKFGFFNETAPWLPLVRAILGPDACLIATGCILSLPGSASQQWHSDGDHLASECQLPPHCLNVFVPLVDMATVAVGPTEFTPGTHLQWGRRHLGNVALTAAAGDAILFDYRLRHRGLPNKTSDVVRPLVYITYAKPFFKDEANFSLKRYPPLPTLVPVARKRKGVSAP